MNKDTLYLEDRLVNMENHNRDISSNVNSMVAILRDIRTLMQDTRRLINNEKCNEFLRQDGCNHILGYTRNVPDKRPFLAKVSDEIPEWKLVGKFKYCPTCGYKIN